jgi:hypothetical protein
MLLWYVPLLLENSLTNFIQINGETARFHKDYIPSFILYIEAFDLSSWLQDLDKNKQKNMVNRAET